ncbi:hypothetical protein KYB31_19945 [Clostridium felsineum]|uniref:hypothetical protein n=1 Tax=Clostridium felsineum TaxID=36839 RepID=UPI00214D74BC|nr:hypothetical protein [Clostridium felsineum]MCR3761251.1 hypothetical protein [Clostridium felsineum]
MNYNLKDIEKNPWLIEKVDNQYEELCILCVKKAWNTLKLIKKPTEKVIENAVKTKGWAIQYVKNPSEKVSLKAIETDWDSIRYIKNPSLKVMIKSVQLNWEAIKYLDNPPFEVKKIAAEKNEESVMYLDNISDDEKKQFIKANIKVLKYIKFEDDSTIKDILIDKLNSNEVERQYVVDFLEIRAIKMDKIKFIHKYGSKKAKMYTVDYKLSR